MRSTRLLTIAAAIVLAVSCSSTLMAQYMRANQPTKACVQETLLPF